MEPNKMGEAVRMGAAYQEELLAKCARGEHDPGYKYGVFGIIVGLVCCPCGWALTLTDRQVRCVRCGELTDMRPTRAF